MTFPKPADVAPTKEQIDLEIKRVARVVYDAAPCSDIVLTDVPEWAVRYVRAVAEAAGWTTIASDIDRTIRLTVRS